ncbi:MBL fold metallo-hydrolase [Rhizobium rhizosphaerae]|uniref:MBL fold metallo-hydrolase n=1 Tax=Xaviernesmea rhizosphaerae TaxID=1672749 RepID=A0A1Q9ACB8_9HYPH|nr:MBL fold metallo-hydrolase [Xaviernesmea rhizosphaerae]OLP52536.1 MBL fold metallo-hydrolase [Xaviernesmea rhizosphaerae]
MGGVAQSFGPFSVTRLIDGVFEAPVADLRHLGGSGPLAAFTAGVAGSTLPMDVNCFLLRSAEGLTLVDAGCGSAWGARYGHARAAMKEAGIDPGDIDRVLITHLHGDHALGLIEGESAYFPRAEIIIPARDFAFFTDEAQRAAVPAARRGGFDVAARVRRAYGDRIRLVGEGAVTEGIVLLPLPGHTPGQAGYRLGSGENALVIIGDALHLAEAQAADPDLGFIYDVDPVIAGDTRRRLLGEAAEQGWALAGGHLPGILRARATEGRFVLTAV